jgi:hypothetical protein
MARDGARAGLHCLMTGRAAGVRKGSSATLDGCVKLGEISERYRDVRGVMMHCDPCCWVGVRRDSEETQLGRLRGGVSAQGGGGSQPRRVLPRAVARPLRALLVLHGGGGAGEWDRRPAVRLPLRGFLDSLAQRRVDEERAALSVRWGPGPMVRRRHGGQWRDAGANRTIGAFAAGCIRVSWGGNSVATYPSSDTERCRDFVQTAT